MTAMPIIHVPSGSGKSFWGPGGDRYRFLITGETSGGSCFIVECLVPPPPSPGMVQRMLDAGSEFGVEW